MNRKQKMALYIDKYKDIPRDYDERKQYIIDKYDITGKICIIIYHIRL